MDQTTEHEPENKRRRVHDGGNQRSDREHPQSSNAGQTYSIYASGDTTVGGSPHHIDRSQRPQSSNTGHVQLSDAIRVFFDQKLSSHAEIYCGEQLYGNFASLPIVVKLADENQRNKREPRILSKLNHHSNVISLIETGIFHDGFESRIYIAIDKCHDENLQDFIINRSELSFDEKMIIVEQLIDGVRYIHDKNIVHLDLKPANILFSLDQKTIKIADFGLSEELSGKKMFLKYQFGTNGFRPPESFGNSYISLKTDIFSLGVVIFFVLSSGKNPFGEDFDALNVNVKNGKSDLSYLLVPNLHSIKHLIKCMIETERKNRPSIKQVSEHPCWTEKEAKCDFEYATSESSDSDHQSDSEEDEPESDLTTLTELLARYSSKDEPSEVVSFNFPENSVISRDGAESAVGSAFSIPNDNLTLEEKKRALVKRKEELEERKELLKEGKELLTLRMKENDDLTWEEEERALEKRVEEYLEELRKEGSTSIVFNLPSGSTQIQNVAEAQTAAKIHSGDQDSGSQLEQYLKGNDVPQWCIDILKENDVDYDVFHDLAEDDFQKMGFKVGPQRKLKKLQMKQSSSDHNPR